MQVRQDSTDHTQAQHANAAGIFASAPLAHATTIRTTALIATISLVAIALYMTRPDAAATGSKDASIHITGPAAPASHAEAQREGETPGQPAETQQNTSSVRNSITVNGKEVAVPQDGNLHKTITNGDTTTTVDVSSSSDSSTTSTSSNVSVHSSSDVAGTEEP